MLSEAGTTVLLEGYIMRIGQINKDNYMEYTKLFQNLGSKNAKQATIQSSSISNKSTNTTSIYARQAQAQATNPNFVYKTKNSDGVTGMDITGKTAADFKIVDVSSDIKDELVGLAKKVFLENYGMNDGEEMSATMKKYIYSAPESERANVAWTVNQIWLEEYGRIENLVKESIPGWKPGQAFDRNAVNELISGSRLDTKV